MKTFFATFFKNGSWLVILIVAIGVFSSALTSWKYTRNVFSTREAEVITPEGMVEAFFPNSLENKILSGQKARVSFQTRADLPICQATVNSVQRTSQGERKLILVTLQVQRQSEKKEQPCHLRAGLRCSVTIDATIPK